MNKKRMPIYWDVQCTPYLAQYFLIFSYEILRIDINMNFAGTNYD